MLGSGLAANGGLYRVKVGDTTQGFCCHGRTSGLLHIIKLPARMRLTRCEPAGAALAEPIEARLAIHLQNAIKAAEMGSWALRFAIRATEIDGSQRALPCHRRSSRA